MKSHLLSSTGGSLQAPPPSQQKVKIEFNAQRVPPTLDDIFKAVQGKTLMASKNVTALFRKTMTPKSGFASHVEQFNFGALRAKDIRDAEKEGHDFIKAGLFQLPYPVCLYRCQVHYPNDDRPLGISLLLVDGKWHEEIWDDGDVRADANMAGRDLPGYATVCFTHSDKHMTAMHSINTMNWKDEPDGTAIEVEIPKDEHAYWRETTTFDAGDPQINLRDMAEGSLLAVGLTMILNTKNIRKERIAPPAKPNKKRAAAGKPLLPWVTRVYTSVYNRATEPGTGTHASPRPHRRRAHVRHYPATQHRAAYAVPIAAMLVNWDGAPLERGQYEVHGDD